MSSYTPMFRKGRWLLLVVGLLVCTTLVPAQFQLRGPPLKQRPPDQIVNTAPLGSPPVLVTVAQKVPLMPDKHPIGPLNNGSLTPEFVYDLVPGNIGFSGGGGSFSGGGGGFSGGGGGFGGSFGGGGFGGGSFGGGGFGGGSFGGGGFGGGSFGGGGFGGFGGAGFTMAPPGGFGFGGTFAGFGGAVGGPGF